MKKFNLPDPGEGLVEAEIVTWRVARGDAVRVNDIVVEIETSKSLVELPIPWAGTVAEILVPEGQTVEVGTPIIVIDDGTGGDAGSDDAGTGEAGADAGAAGAKDDGDAGEERVPNLVGYGAAPTSTKRRARRQPASDPSAAEAARAAARSLDTHEPVGYHTDEAQSMGGPAAGPGAAGSLPAPGAANAPTGAPSGRPRAKPPLRKFAKNLGVDLATVTPTGPDGTITREDVRQAAAGGTAAAPLAGATALGGGEVRVPIKGVRKATAAAMVASAFTAPHVTEWVEVDVTATMELIARLKARRDFAEVKLSPTVLVARAVCLAARANPEVNASWDDANQEIVLHPHVNLGIAAATPRGLMVPNIKGAETLGLRDLAEHLQVLVQTARDGKTQPADMSGGTMTITNIGVFGVDAGTPILNPGEAMIVATGQIIRKPWVVGSGADERVEPRHVMTLACSFDHRLVDGEQGSKFLAHVAGILADPGLAML